MTDKEFTRQLILQGIRNTGMIRAARVARGEHPYTPFERFFRNFFWLVVALFALYVYVSPDARSSTASGDAAQASGPVVSRSKVAPEWHQPRSVEVHRSLVGTSLLGTGDARESQENAA
jgi:hypothetical protein